MRAVRRVLAISLGADGRTIYLTLKTLQPENAKTPRRP